MKHRLGLKTITLLRACLFGGAMLAPVWTAADSLAAVPAETSDETSIDYSRQILPILANHCFKCHGPDAAQRESGLRLDRRDEATKPVDSGKTAIVPGHSANSELARRIISEDADVVMPPPEANKPLSDQQKQLLKRWIDEGARYDVHWSFRAPRRPGVPGVERGDWPRNEIDHFVLHRLEQEGLQPSGEADRATLIRRLSLDLTGLPPTIPEVDAFLEDDSPVAYERVVSRLLASPHYGEKMAVGWLDLARFGDTNGYQDDAYRPSWPYRDHVIAAFNENQPFDQFTIENLAGDLLSNATLSQKVASGFNRQHRQNEEGGSDPDEFRVVYAVDRTNTTATVWMGLTFGCAQCHEHKYDPFTQREYYQLYAFFNSLKGEIPISNKNPNVIPPQIRVPSPDQQARIDRLDTRLAMLASQLDKQEPQFLAAFQNWLETAAESIGEPEPAVDKDSPGVAGGVINRSQHKSFYADSELQGSLTLDHPMTASGRLLILSAKNSGVVVGHCNTNSTDDDNTLGISVEDGPFLLGRIDLSDGNTLETKELRVRHGVEYTWTYRWNPSGRAEDSADADAPGDGSLTLEIREEGRLVGRRELALNAAHRRIGASLDAFGIVGNPDDDGPSETELYIDDVEYVIDTAGNTREQSFDGDPGWFASRTTERGNRYGYDAAGTTASRDDCTDTSVREILAISPELRTESQQQCLRRRFMDAHDPARKRLLGEIAALRTEREELINSLPQTLVMAAMQPRRPAHVLVRGDFQQQGEVVSPDVPAIFHPLPPDQPRNRLILARWLVEPEHPLTSRVAVNRIWNQFFGHGLVRTMEDFGTRGEPPTHPDLLDFLAVGFVADGWNVKRLQRRIVTSATYRQASRLTAGTPSGHLTGGLARRRSSALSGRSAEIRAAAGTNRHSRGVTPDLLESDPENRLLARGARFRLSAEEIRDTALAVSGLLVRRIGGPSVHPYQPAGFYGDKSLDWNWPQVRGPDLYRRGIYTFLRRTTPYPSFQTFDAPSRGECTVNRPRTNTPLQALVTLNDPVFVETARVFGQRIMQDGGDTLDARLTSAFRWAVARRPTENEMIILRRLFDDRLRRYRADPQAALALVEHGRAERPADLDVQELAAWTSVGSALLNLDETITRE